MSLGRHRGPALIGKPLDISVQAVLDAQDDVAGLCLEADVFYAENKIDSSKIRVGLTRTSPSSTDAVITIRSSALIDEPVVTVYLRSGCQQKIERRYVLLADLVSDTVAQGAISSARNGLMPSEFPVPLVPVIVSRAVPADSTSSQQTGRQPALRLKLATESSSQVAPRGPNATRTAARKPPANSNRLLDRNSVPADRSRASLKLEPLDSGIDRSPALKASTELLSLPAANEQQRSVAAALWKTLTARPEDVLKDTERLRELESSVASLRAELQRNKRSVSDLSTEVSKAQSERYRNALVYSLFGLLLIALAGILFLWRKQYVFREPVSDQLPWWRRSKLQDKGWGDSAPGGSDGLGAQGSQPFARLTPGQQKKRSGQVDLDLDIGGDDVIIPARGYSSIRREVDSLNSLPSRDRSDFAMSMTHMSRAVKAEELFDVQQQADFFVSLGQHEQAIEVLREHIKSNAQTSALVYLDLFNLYHLLKRESDYEELREEFGNLFNARMPEFSLYSDNSPGLEAYPAALERIVALWHSPKALDVIEESIFRKIDGHSEAFDLGAYRELLLLYAIAKEVANFGPQETAGSDYGSGNALTGPAIASFASTSVQPPSASVLDESVVGGNLPVVFAALPKPSPRLGLDVDLSELFDNDLAIKLEAEKVTVSEVESDSQFFTQFSSGATLALRRDTKELPLPSSTTRLRADNLIDF